MTLQDEQREFDRALREFGVTLAIAYLPLARALAVFTHRRALDFDSIEANLRRRLDQLKDQRPSS